MSLIEGQAVQLSEVAAQLGTSTGDVEREAVELFGPPLGCDWTGAVAVTVEQAHAMVTGDARRAHDSSAAWRAHERRLEQWESDLEDARKAAFQVAYDESLRRGLGAPRAASDAHPAAREAVAKFEKAHPKPEFNQSSTVPAAVAKATKRFKEALSR